MAQKDNNQNDDNQKANRTNEQSHSSCDSDKSKDEYSSFNESVFMPFGIFNTDKMSIGRASETLVGRNNERASFIRRLLNSGKGGAYLITGYGGTGRSSFVSHCLNVYENNIVKRFYNSKLSKGFTDRIASVIFVLSLVLLPGFFASIYAFADVASSSRIILLVLLTLCSMGLVKVSYQPISVLFHRSGFIKFKPYMRFSQWFSVRLKDLLRFSYPFLLYMILAVITAVLIYFLGFTAALILIDLLVISTFVLVYFCLGESRDTRLDPALIRVGTLCVFKSLLGLWYLISILLLVFKFHYPELRIVGYFNSDWLLLLCSMVFTMTLIFMFEIPHVITASLSLMEKNTLHSMDYTLLPKCFNPDLCKGESYEDIKEQNRYRNYYSMLRASSWVRAYLGVWKPVLKIHIDLGTNDIKYNNIVYGILRQLKVKHTKYFLGIRNMRVICLKMFIFTVFSFLSIQIGDSLFAFKHNYQSIEFNTEEQRMAFKTPPTRQKMNSSMVAHLFGFNLYQAFWLDNKRKISSFESNKFYYIKTTFMNYDSKCVEFDSIPIPVLEVAAQGRIEPCLKDKPKASMLNEQLFYWLYLEVFTIEPQQWDKEPLGHYGFMIELFLNKSVFPFNDYDYKLPKAILNSDVPNDMQAFKNRVDLPQTERFDERYVIRTYHIFVFMLLSIFYLFINRYMTFLPYRSNSQKLTKVMNRLTSTQSKDSRLSVAGMSFNLPFMENQVFEPMNSRDIEQHFIDVLRSISRHDSCLVSHLTSVPTPEIIIVFDNLDKLGDSGVEANLAANSDIEENSAPMIVSKNIARAKDMLLSMKNVIGAGHCKFIFIGGRSLREEWLTEQSKREQLLSRIFDMVIYLPSLLTDAKSYGSKIGESLMLDRIKEYVNQQYVKANRIYGPYDKYERSRFMLYSFAEFKEQETFANQDLIDVRVKLFYKSGKSGLQEQNEFYRSNNQLELLGHNNTKDFLDQFTKYLAYRTHGIPKRIKEVFAGYIKPLDRVLIHNHSPKDKKEIVQQCRDVLLLTDTDLYRIQFTCRLYSRIDRFIGRRIYARDDKLVLAVLFVTDYLLKFHEQAFDWDSLEIIEDIADINRIPDIRDMIHEVVHAFAEMMLHPILNGMYSFRFKSSTARELVYMSKLSATESAAFNFTLDESQSLKKLYLARISKGGSPCADTSAILAELYLFDQEYDAARSQYYETIKLVDERLSIQLRMNFGMGGDKSGTGYLSVMEELEKKKGSPNNHSVSFVIDWLVFRLRLMLKIGLSFEHTRNYERAHAIYHEAHMLSRRAIRLMMNEKTTVSIDGEVADFPSSFFTAKHFNIIYQAAFAKAWLSEKLGTGVDTSLTITKLELNFFENMFMSFSLDKELYKYMALVKQNINSNASFGLIKSELFDKAGDLCFFKGSSVNTQSNNYLPEGKNGYLYKASYYYLVALHYLRLYNTYRTEASRVKYSAEKPVGPSFSEQHIPYYPSVQLSSILADIAEVFYARIDLESLMRKLRSDNDSNKEKLFIDSDKITSEGKNLENSLNRFMITAGVYFDSWLRYCDVKDAIYLKSSSFKEKAQEVFDSKKFGHYEPLFSLWVTEDNKPQISDPVNFIDYWLGKVDRTGVPMSVSKDKVEHGEEELIYSEIVQRCDLEKICCYLSLANMSITHLRNSGNIEDAAYEMRRAVDSILALLDSIILLRKYRLENEKELFKGDLSDFADTNLHCLAGFLVSQAVYFIDRAAIFHGIKGQKKEINEKTENGHKLVMSKLVLVAIRLCVVAMKLSKLWSDYSFIYRLQKGHQGRVEGSVGKKHKYSLQSIIKGAFESDVFIANDNQSNLLKSWLREFFAIENRLFGKNSFQQDFKNIANWLSMFQTLLINRAYTNRYPILNRLNMLSTLASYDQAIDYVNYDSGKGISLLVDLEVDCLVKQVKQSIQYVKELLETEILYDSPFHFTPTQMGFTFYSLARQIDLIKKQADKYAYDNDLDARYYYLRASEFFSKARQMYTMQSEYYRTISDLYYLYDDFNDRYIHHSKAIQIMSASLVLRIERVIRDRLKELEHVD